MSGWRCSQAVGGRLRHMVLTTSDEARTWDLVNDCRILFKRITRKYGQVEFFKVRTSEGNGVLHILYRGSFIPQSWLSSMWSDIHQSPNVWITEACKRHIPYVINQYLAGQSQFERYSSSWYWVYPGFVHMWRTFYRMFGDRCLEQWRTHLSGYPILFVYNSQYMYEIKPPPEPLLFLIKKRKSVKCANQKPMLSQLAKGRIEIVNTLDDFMENKTV